MVSKIFYLFFIWSLIFGLTLWGIKSFLFAKRDARVGLLKDMRVRANPIGNRPREEGVFSATFNLLGRFSMPADVGHVSKLRIRFLNAGFRGDTVSIVYFSLKTFLTLIVPFISFAYSYYQGHTISSALFLATILAVLGYFLPDLFLNILIKKRQRELMNTFPDALDLVRICVSSGLGLDAAISRVGDEIRLVSPTLAEEFEQLSLELRAGSSRENALNNLATRTGLKDIEALVAMLKQANRFGTNVTEALHIFSEDLRAKRKTRAQEIAAKIPVKISMPIILCIFPALFVVILGPAIIGLVNTMHSSASPLGG
jgi:tight adherence protein C